MTTPKETPQAMTSDQLKEIVDQILLNLENTRQKEFSNEAINWGNLCCVQARQFVDGSWLVEIEEADPSSSQLCIAVEEELATMKIDADVKCEW